MEYEYDVPKVKEDILLKTENAFDPNRVSDSDSKNKCHASPTAHIEPISRAYLHTILLSKYNTSSAVAKLVTL